jgi:hypothetical protein
MRLLLDECVPRPLRRDLTGHDAHHVVDLGWSSKRNGELLTLMAAERVETLLTVDRNLPSALHTLARARHDFEAKPSGRALPGLVERRGERRQFRWQAVDCVEGEFEPGSQRSPRRTKPPLPDEMCQPVGRTEDGGGVGHGVHHFTIQTHLALRNDLKLRLQPRVSTRALPAVSFNLRRD